MAGPGPRCGSATTRWSWRHWRRRACWTRTPVERAALTAALEAPTLNPLLELGPRAWSALRARLAELLEDPGAGLAGTELAERALAPLDQAEALLPIEVGDYVDFYSSLEHASNVGALVRPDGDPLFPNWRHLPVGYHGRAGSVVPSGTPVRRPQGQSPPEQPGGSPGFGPERLLDFELELGFVTGPGLSPGEPVTPAELAGHVFGFALVNDWSARSMQAWEYQPLGPFLSKSFATSLATWITPLEALDPFRVEGPAQEPAPPAYLRSDEPWALDLELEVALVPAGSGDEQVISRTNSRLLYWSAAQQLAHATINGAEVRAGDLYASGTISGSEPGTQGCLLELTRLGREPLRAGGRRHPRLPRGRRRGHPARPRRRRRGQARADAVRGRGRSSRRTVRRPRATGRGSSPAGAGATRVAGASRSCSAPRAPARPRATSRRSAGSSRSRANVGQPHRRERVPHHRQLLGAPRAERLLDQAGLRPVRQARGVHGDRADLDPLARAEVAGDVVDDLLGLQVRVVVGERRSRSGS